ncbi:MAG TPA: superoxide dismutase family protein [Limnochordia bacterium]
MSRRTWFVVGLAALVVAGASAWWLFSRRDPPLARPDAGAEAILIDTAGRVIGRADFYPLQRGVLIRVQASGLPAGPHGIHIHEVGRCEPPDFSSAGAHYNPFWRQHGLANPRGPHAGDLPNLVAAPTGGAFFEAVNLRLTLGRGEGTLLDADGSALVIHAQGDDHLTDPSGNSGARIACGVIRRTPTA